MTNTKIELTDGMRRALLAAGSTRQGANVTESGRCSGEAAYMLRDTGLIGRGGGLTRAGSILAARLRRQAEEVAFA